ncbi:sortase domain-bontaining protein [Streptomyces sp. TP-A0356]|uniref:sortase domain-containing protein n=1 Tax=Streptomyces sp. TP-A0356 TaxID=1359208 RepID=UPI0006E297F0|nr:sortase [Streptomyces sp. TP-A0356]
MGPGRVADGHRPAHGASASSAVKLADTMRASRPVKLKVPSAGVDAGPLLELGLDDRRQLQAPPMDKADKPGWYTGSVPPGEKGVSVLLAHYNTPKGPGLLRNVMLLKVGDPITVQRADGHTVTFVVRKLEQVSKEKVAEHDLKLSSQHAELRLIASGGSLVKASPKPGRSEGGERAGADAKNADAHYNIVFYADAKK